MTLAGLSDPEHTTDGNAALGSNTTTSRVHGTAVGADYRFSPFTLAGFVLAGRGTHFSVAIVFGPGPPRSVPGGSIRAPHRRTSLYLSGEDRAASKVGRQIE